MRWSASAHRAASRCSSCRRCRKASAASIGGMAASSGARSLRRRTRLLNIVMADCMSSTRRCQSATLCSTARSSSIRAKASAVVASASAEGGPAQWRHGSIARSSRPRRGLPWPGRWQRRRGPCAAWRPGRSAVSVWLPDRRRRQCGGRLPRAVRPGWPIRAVEHPWPRQGWRPGRSVAFRFRRDRRRRRRGRRGMKRRLRGRAERHAAWAYRRPYRRQHARWQGDLPWQPRQPFRLGDRFGFLGPVGVQTKKAFAQLGCFGDVAPMRISASAMASASRMARSKATIVAGSGQAATGRPVCRRGRVGQVGSDGLQSCAQIVSRWLLASAKAPGGGSFAACSRAVRRVCSASMADSREARLWLARSRAASAWASALPHASNLGSEGRQLH